MNSPFVLNATEVKETRLPGDSSATNVFSKVKETSKRHQIFTATSIPPPPIGGYRSFTHQVGGHLAVQTSPCFMLDDDDHILKLLELKSGRRCMEEVFYQTVFNREPNNEDWSELKTFMPHYYGTKQLIHNNKSLNYIKMENLIQNLDQPCIIDIKMGKKTFDPFADPDKVQRELNRYKYQAQIGFRVTGFKVFKLRTNVTELYDRFHCKNIRPEDITNTFAYFFDLGNFPERRTLLLAVIRKLKQLLRWFEKQTRIKFYRTSLLIAYDGKAVVAEPECNKEKLLIGKQERDESIDNIFSKSLSSRVAYHVDGKQCLHSSFQNRNFGSTDACYTHTMEKQYFNSEKVIPEDLTVVRMIDFAHTFCDLEDLSNSVDDNYIYGLRSLIRELEKCLDFQA